LSVNHECLFDELERVQHPFQTVMDHLKIEVLHRPRISIGRIGESDSNVQFVVAPFVSLTEKAVA